MIVVRSEREARDLSIQRQQVQKDRERRTVKKLTLEELYSQIQQGDLKELRLVIVAGIGIREESGTYNSVLIFDQSGKLAGRYRKTHNAGRHAR